MSSIGDEEVDLGFASGEDVLFEPAFDVHGLEVSPCDEVCESERGGDGGHEEYESAFSGVDGGGGEGEPKKDEQGAFAIEGQMQRALSHRFGHRFLWAKKKVLSDLKGE